MKTNEESEFHLLKNIIRDAIVPYPAGYSFCLFCSIDRILYLIYTSREYSIISYDLINDKRINQIKKAHNNYISNFRQYLDGINKRDLLISVSTLINNIKVWNIKNYECLCNLENIYDKSVILSACLLNENNKIFIVTCNEPQYFFEEIKVFELKGNIYKKIYNYDDLTHYIDSYYDNNLSKNFIITGNASYPRSYDYSNSKLYHKYSDDNNKGQYYMTFYDKDDILKLIESSSDAYIRIWDFHSGKLLSKINISDTFYCKIYSFCVSNNNYLCAGMSGGKVIEIDLKTKKLVSFSSNDKNDYLAIQTVEHSKYGECLISQDCNRGQIKLWKKK